ncbi:16193_t:CDS:2 [Funneliformis geosporum]|uniref:4852_t:CDS:1 n=1 Tax=Funneliformis geosporum TaxID=1117311 RepID=A0A9W4SNR1_9GLOM|nr:16193_t:CDS:2 [Funneliformis geosporum]CAI2174966.1 4852_t:CDS:2 [Funneliformis geosporum]
MSKEDGGSRLNDNGFGLGYVQSLVDKLSLTERKKLSEYLRQQNQQHLTKDIISALPLPMATYLLEFLDAENLCKIRQVSKTWKDRATENTLWKRQCTLAGFSINLISKSFNYSKNAEDHFFQLYKHHIIIQRHWEKHKCTQYLMRAHQEGITCIAGSEYGNMIYTGSFDKTIKMWDLFNWTCLKVLKDHSEGVQCLALGQFILASGSWDKSIIIYDINNDHAIKYRLNGHLAGIISLTMNPNESILYSGSVDKTIRIWNIHTGDCLQRLYGHDGTVGTLMLIPRISSLIINEEQEEQQYWLISGSNDNSILIWDLNPNPSEEQLSNFQSTSPIKPQIVKRLEGNTRAVTCLAWYKDLVQQIDDADQDQLDDSPRSIHIDTLGFLSRSPSPCTNITREVELMDLDDPDSLIQPNHNESIQQHCQRTHHNRLNQNNISSSPSNTVTPPPSPPENLNTNNHSNDMEFSDSNISRKSIFIFSASADSTIRMWDLNTGQLLHSTKEHTEIVWDLQCNESRLISVSSDGYIKHYQLNNSRSLAEPKKRSSFNIPFPAVTLAQIDSGVTCLKMTREWLVCGTEDGVLIALEFFTRD